MNGKRTEPVFAVSQSGTIEESGKVPFYREFLRDSYKRIENSAKEALTTHFGKDIVFTGTWAEVADERELEEEELLEGEVSASVFTIGCYSVRIAECLYAAGKSADIHYGHEMSAGKDARMVTEVSARYNPSGEAPVEHWQNICTAASDHEWPETIGYICTVQKNPATPDEQAVLVVLKHSEGNPNSVGYWYKFTPDGKIERYNSKGIGGAVIEED